MLLRTVYMDGWLFPAKSLYEVANPHYDAATFRFIQSPRRRGRAITAAR
jgi:hypothetical protein